MWTKEALTFGIKSYAIEENLYSKDMQFPLHPFKGAGIYLRQL